MNIYEEIVADPHSTEDQKAAAQKALELSKPKVIEGDRVTLTGEIQQFNWDTRKMDRVKVEPLVVSRDAAVRLRAKAATMMTEFSPQSFYDGYAANLGYGEIMLAQLRGDSADHKYDTAHVAQLRADYPESDIPDALTDEERKAWDDEIERIRSLPLAAPAWLRVSTSDTNRTQE